MALLLCLPALAVAQERCPWMNRATAAGYLGGDVKMTVTPASCDFVRAGYELRIEVRGMKEPHASCSADAEPLKAIGNEAQACSFTEKPGWVAEQVVSRVRDKAFLVRVGASDAGASRKALREKARAVAEQIAGILF